MLYTALSGVLSMSCGFSAYNMRRNHYFVLYWYCYNAEKLNCCIYSDKTLFHMTVLFGNRLCWKNSLAFSALLSVAFTLKLTAVSWFRALFVVLSYSLNTCNICHVIQKKPAFWQAFCFIVLFFHIIVSEQTSIQFLPSNLLPLCCIYFETVAFTLKSHRFFVTI